jgi:hypothetical protein
MSSGSSKPGTGSETPPAEFFVDRSLGSTFTQGLRDLGWLVTSITDVFTNDAQEVSDTDWIRYGCDAGWAALTKDVKIRRSPHYDAATRPIFALSDGNLPLRENVRRFEAWRDKIWTVATGDAGREFWVCTTMELCGEPEGDQESPSGRHEQMTAPPRNHPVTLQCPAQLTLGPRFTMLSSAIGRSLTHLCASAAECAPALLGVDDATVTNVARGE